VGKTQHKCVYEQIEAQTEAAKANTRQVWTKSCLLQHFSLKLHFSIFRQSPTKHTYLYPQMPDHL